APLVMGALGVSAAAQVAAMTPDKQQAFIRRMVAGLADRLKSNGNDIDGWLRLVRAYRVLQEPEKAKDALGDAKRTFAGDPAATKRLDDLAQELGLNG
ncbi:MAG: c-type cytochrome biogenesis protein CcmI, partial [Beijerinckiaceae bacterium]|nr:c-type cytochrome biogenesis protein CcmI [Beijerinckiaceae bacterium]